MDKQEYIDKMLNGKIEFEQDKKFEVVQINRVTKSIKRIGLFSKLNENSISYKNDKDETKSIQYNESIFVIKDGIFEETKSAIELMKFENSYRLEELTKKRKQRVKSFTDIAESIGLGFCYFITRKIKLLREDLFNKQSEYLKGLIWRVYL